MQKNPISYNFLISVFVSTLIKKMDDEPPSIDKAHRNIGDIPPHENAIGYHSSQNNKRFPQGTGAGHRYYEEIKSTIFISHLWYHSSSMISGLMFPY